MTKKTEIAVLASLAASLVALALVGELHRRLGPVLDGAGSALLAALAGLVAAIVGLGLFVVFPLVRAQTREQGQLHSLADSLRSRSIEMERAALTDVLTGLSNRRYFDEALGEYLAEFARIERPLGLMVLDLDRFKAINDTHGHDVGDRVLQAVAGCLLDVTRHHDVVARLGGEEFAVLVPNMDAGALALFAERVRGAVERLIVPAGNVRLRITVSVGLAVAGQGEAAAAFFKRADVALYGAKDGGRNRICA